MKKTVQKMMALIALLSLFLNVAVPNALAQVQPAELLQKIAAAEAKLEAGHITGSVKVSIENQGQSADLAEVKLDTRFNVNDLSGVLALDVLSPFLGEETMAIQAYLKDNVATLLMPGSVQVNELSDEDVASFKETLSTYQEQATSNSMIMEGAEEYYDITEDDMHYTLALKEGFDGKKMYEDANKDGALDKLKEDMLKELEKQGAVTDDTRAIYDRIYSPEFFELVFKSIKSFTAKYDKNTFLATSTEMELAINPQEFATLFQVDLADFEGVPVPELLKIKYTINVDEHNQPQTIEVPEITVEQAESSSSN